MVKIGILCYSYAIVREKQIYYGKVPQLRAPPHSACLSMSLELQAIAGLCSLDRGRAPPAGPSSGWQLQAETSSVTARSSGTQLHCFFL